DLWAWVNAAISRSGCSPVAALPTNTFSDVSYVNAVSSLFGARRDRQKSKGNEK
ncbi:hypothetical protein GE21DRAFT_1179168, partial [Neurospora crassa]